MISRKRILVIYLILLGLLLLGGIVCTFMLFNIALFNKEKHIAKWESMQAKDNEVIAPRGEIFDCNGKKLAITEQRYRFYFDPLTEQLNKERTRKENPDDPNSPDIKYTYFNEGLDSLCICLSEHFGGTSREYKNKIIEGKSKGKRHIALVKRTISSYEKELIRTFPIFRRGQNKGGLIIEKSDHAERNYLYGDLARRTIGNVNVTGGIMGIELSCDSFLTGINGLENRQRISRSQTIRIPKEEPIPGNDIHTTINIDYQEVCYQALIDNLSRYPAEQACLVLMEVKTGAIRAIVNLQRNENAECKYSEMGPLQTNMALADLSNPGSTFKAVSLMIAMEEGICDTSTMVKLDGGQTSYHNQVMKDDHQVVPDEVNIMRIFAESSNVGVSKIINKAYYGGREKEFVAAVEDLGFGSEITLGLHRSKKLINKPRVPQVGTKQWSGLSIPWLSIGYEILTPPIYTLMFYNAIANDGKMVEPYLIDYVKDEKGSTVYRWQKNVINKKICSDNTIKKLKAMLEGVVKKGTASKTIKESSVPLAGKTGTAQLKDSPSKGLQLSFCGYFPADNPKYSCIVVYKRPMVPAYPPQTSCRVFKNVAERITSIDNKLYISDLPHIKKDSVNLPTVKGGSAKEIYRSLDALSVSTNRTNGNYVKLEHKDSKIEATQYVQKEGVIPNVIGLGANDALFILESAGMNVQLFGRGKVISQSPYAGEPIREGGTISLTLR